MFPTRLIKVLVVALSATSVAQASWIDVKLQGRNEHGMMKRQRATGSSASSGSISSTSSTISTPSTSLTTPTTPTSSTTTTPSPSPSSTPTSSSSITPTPASSTSKLPTSTTSSTPTSTSTTPVPVTPTSSSSSVAPVISTVTSVVTATNSDGSPTTYTTESQTTSTAGLVDNASNNSSSMSSQTRTTIIGVVCGLGGAILLGGLGFLAWRIWGRRRHADDNDDMLNYGVGTGYSPVEKTTEASASPPAGRSPFQSTLESYHAPTQVNTASNF